MQDPAYGADVLRLWVASVDYAVDVAIGRNILKQVFDAYRKLRGSLRFMLGNVHDYDPSRHAVDTEKLPLMDRYMLHRFRKLSRSVNASYDAYNFGAIYRALNSFLSADLSAFYFELGKDRLYIRGADAFERRSCQTVLHTMLRGLLAAVAPLTPHMAEDAWRNVPAVADASVSVFQAGVPEVPDGWELSAQDLELAQHAMAAKDVIMQALERARVAKAIGAGLDARVALCVEDERARAALAALNESDNGVDGLKWSCVTSAVTIVAQPETSDFEVSETVVGLGKVTASVFRASGTRCERCWHHSERVGDEPAHPQLCERCAPVVQEMGFEVPEPDAAAVPEAEPAAV